MLTTVIRIYLAIAIFYLVLTPCCALRGFGSRGYNGGKYNSYNNGKYNGYQDSSKSKTYVGTSSGIPSQNVRRGLGISAWGIVTVIVVLILAGMGFYYFSMCYPFLCKKERSYDIMKLDNA